MTVQAFVVTGRVIKNLPVINNQSVLSPEKPFYSLFTWNGRSWRNCRTQRLSMAGAYRVWGELVVSEPKLYSIRRAQIELKGAN